MQLGEQNSRAMSGGQVDMFGLAADAKQNLPPARAVALPDWSEALAPRRASARPSGCS